MPDPPHGPAATNDDAPVLPAAPPRPEPTTEATTFDARAMVESMKSSKESPLYGGLPTATPESRAAAQALRDEARRRRKRNKRLGWWVALIVLAVVVTAGVLAYREYQQDQDRREAEREGAAAAPIASDDSSTTDADVDVDVDADVDAAAPLVSSDADVTDVSAAPTAVTQPPVMLTERPALADLPDFRTIEFGYRIYDSAEVADEFSDFWYTYDTRDDNYVAFLDRSDTDGDTMLAFTGRWAAQASPTRPAERVLRSLRSLDPRPDAPWATVFGADRVVPAEMMPFATVDDGTGPDDQGGWIDVFRVDLAAFRDAQPEAHADWLAFWTAPAADADVLVDRSVRQVDANPPSSAGLLQRQSTDLSSIEVEAPDDGSALVFARVDNSGVVTLVGIIDPDDDVSVSWVLGALSNEPARVEFDDREWVDAP